MEAAASEAAAGRCVKSTTTAMGAAEPAAVEAAAASTVKTATAATAVETTATAAAPTTATAPTTPVRLSGDWSRGHGHHADDHSRDARLRHRAHKSILALRPCVGDSTSSVA
jgi:hypothetical protein